MIVSRPTAAGRRYLLLRAYRYWDFPKGLCEAGEDPLQTAIREAEEETGISDLRFPDDHPWYETEPYAGGKTARYYRAETTTEEVVLGVNPEMGRPEHHEFRWVDAGQASELLNERVGKALQWAISSCTD